jgi:protein tyrosine/serine phosphatase
MRLRARKNVKKMPPGGVHRHHQVEVDLSTPGKRLRAWANMLLADHGLVRLFLSRHHVVSEGRLYRAMQPLPHQLRAAKRAGIRTIINLRGRRQCGSYFLEENLCRQLGLTLINFPSHSRETPTRDFVNNAKAMFDVIDYPALMHCKSGADRAGLMAALYLILKENRPAEEALSHLSLKYGHIKQARTGVLDHFFESYIAANRARPVGFLDWVNSAYDLEAVKKSFRPQGLASVLVDIVLRRE